MLKSGKVVQSCSLLAGIFIVSPSVWAAESPGIATTQPTGAVGALPQTIVLNSPAQTETTRSCVLYRRGGGRMRVVSAEASDAAIAVKVREDQSAGTWVVSAMLPAGYEHPGKKQVEIVVTAELDEQPNTRGADNGGFTQRPGASKRREVSARPTGETPVPQKHKQEVLRIPLRVLPARTVSDPGWMRGPKEWIGRLLPVIHADLATGGDIHIAATEGTVTVVVFSAHWCGHCDQYMPIIEKVAKDYAGRDVKFYGINNASGDGSGISRAIERWEVDWPVGIDTQRTIAAEFGVRAYPVIFVVNKHGEIEAAHGRWANTPDHNGLDGIEAELRSEIDVLLAGGTRADFPIITPAVQTRPAGLPTIKKASTTRPALPVMAPAALAPSSRPAAG